MIKDNQPHEQHSADAGELGGGRAKPEHFHTRQVEQFTEALDKDSEKALQRWGLPLFHSLPDEVAQAQREKFGFKTVDALDFYNHGCLLALNNDHSGAVKAFEAALKLNPELTEAAYNRAMSFEQGGYTANAREAWLEYLEKYAEGEDALEIKAHLSNPVA